MAVFEVMTCMYNGLKAQTQIRDENIQKSHNRDNGKVLGVVVMSGRNYIIIDCNKLVMTRNRSYQLKIKKKRKKRGREKKKGGGVQPARNCHYNQLSAGLNVKCTKHLSPLWEDDIYCICRLSLINLTLLSLDTLHSNCFNKVMIFFLVSVKIFKEDFFCVTSYLLLRCTKML